MMPERTRNGIPRRARHGRLGVAFVCRHLRHGEGLGFFVPDSPPTEEEPWEMTWCAAGETVRRCAQ